ncbi:MAG: hypothetical protein ACREFB_18275, partial [Stellaceae bacterium]
VLVALAIVGLALGAAAATIGTGLSGHEAARDIATALAVADQRLAEAGVTGELRPGSHAGNFAGRFAWHITVALYRDPDAKPGAAAPPSGLRLFRVAVTVSWRDGRRRRQMALSTLRLGPVAP